METDSIEKINIDMNIEPKKNEVIENEVLNLKEQPKEDIRDVYMYDKQVEEIKIKESEAMEMEIKIEENQEIKVESKEINEVHNILKPEEIKNEKIEQDTNKIVDRENTQGEIKAIEGNKLTSDKSEEEREGTKQRLWTREEDKLILEAFQKQLGTEQTFSRISDLLTNRSVDDVSIVNEQVCCLYIKVSNIYYRWIDSMYLDENIYY